VSVWAKGFGARKVEEWGYREAMIKARLILIFLAGDTGIKCDYDAQECKSTIRPDMGTVPVP